MWWAVLVSKYFVTHRYEFIMLKVFITLFQGRKQVRDGEDF